MDLGIIDRMGVKLDCFGDASERLDGFRPVRTVSGQSGHSDDRSPFNETSTPPLLMGAAAPAPTVRSYPRCAPWNLRKPKPAGYRPG